MAYYGSYGNVLNLPETRPSLLLDFANTKSLDPRIDFTRASTGTYYDGKTLEKAEENLVLRSQEFDNSYWTKLRVSATADAHIAPDGTNTADSIIQQSGQSSFGGVYVSVPFVSNNAYTLSIFVKSNGKNFVCIRERSTGGDRQSFFNITEGFVGTTNTDHSASISLAENGYYRCTITFNATTTANQVIYFFVADNDNSQAVIDSGGLYIWGAQLEQRDRATAYTPTTTQPITNYIPVLQTAEQDTARFDHDPATGESLGLLIEEQRTNLADYSEDFIKTVWVEDSASVLQNVGLAPDGTYTANLFIENEGLSYHRIQRNLGSTLNLYTASVYVKAYTKSVFSLRIGRAGVADEGAVFDLANGTILSEGTDIQEAKIVPVGNGWYRVHVTNQTTITGIQYFVLGVGDNTSTFTGDGVSGIYIWGAQLEEGAFSTSYIPTPLTYSGRSSTATYRAPDGLLRIAEPNEPRYEINSGGGSNLVLEGSATNLLTYSENFDGAGWITVRANIANNVIVAPDGTLTGDKLVYSTDGGSHNTRNPDVTISNPSTLTASIFFKQDQNKYVTLGIGDGSGINISFTIFDLQDELIATNFTPSVNVSAPFNQTITPVGNEWYRCSITATVSNVTTAQLWVLGSNASGDSIAFTGDGSSGIYIWGAQLEVGSTATSYIPSVETFTGRSSVGTFYDSTGIVRTAGSGQARYTYNPSNLNAPPTLLLEPAATNLLTYSEDFTNTSFWNVFGGSITTNAATSPDGTNSAVQLIENTSDSAHDLTAVNIPVEGSKTYCRSVYVKGDGSGRFVRIQSDSFANWVNSGSLSFDPYTGNILDVSPGFNNYGVDYVGNGWYRIYIATTTIPDPSPLLGFDLELAFPSQQYLGDGSSGAYFWGPQFEEGYAPSSYIKTEASQVTRAADTSTSASGVRAADVYSSNQVTRSSDNASISGENFSSWFNPQAGTVHTEFETLNFDSSNRDQYIFGFRNSISTGIRMPTRIGNEGITQGTLRSFAFTNSFVYAIDHGVYSGGVGKSTFTYNQINDFQTSFSGTLSAQDITGSLSGATFNQAVLGVDPNNRDRLLNGYLRKIAYYPVRLPNDTLVEITR